MNVNITTYGSEVTRKYPKYDEVYTAGRILSPAEFQSLEEASRAFGVEAYTACEAMSLRTLESALRKIYGVEEMLGSLINRAEKDPRLTDMVGVVQYFRNVRNRVAHPEKLSSKLDAESTFAMTKRLLLELEEKTRSTPS